MSNVSDLFGMSGVSGMAFMNLKAGGDGTGWFIGKRHLNSGTFIKYNVGNAGNTGGSKMGIGNSDRSLDLGAAELQQILATLVNLNKLDMPVDIQRINIGKYAIELKKTLVGETSEYAIAGIWKGDKDPSAVVEPYGSSNPAVAPVVQPRRRY